MSISYLRGLLLIIFASVILPACTGHGGRNENRNQAANLAGPVRVKNIKGDSDVSGLNSDAGRLNTDSGINRVLFQTFFAKFVKAVRQNDREQLIMLIHFPLLTANVRTPNNLEYEHVDTVADLVQRKEFNKYYPDIFYPALQKQFSTLTLDDVKELEQVDEEGYYRILHHITDRGTPMFELYIQWTYTNTGLAGNYSGFVFGKVDSAYKVLSYYGNFSTK